MNFEIAQKDLDIYVNFHDFKLDPTLKNEGWRLPSLEELKEMYKIHQQGKYNFKDDRYMSADYDQPYYNWILNFEDGTTRHVDITESHWGRANIRLVRD